MRWVAIVVFVILGCGGFFALGGYAAFEAWRVGQVAGAGPGGGAGGAPAEAPPPVAAGPSPSCAEGTAAFASKDYERAATLLDVCLEADPDDVEARLLRGRAWAVTGHYARADADLARVMPLRPDSAEGWEAWVYARGNNGDDRGAVTACDQWLEHGGGARALRMRADARWRLGEAEAAVADARTACEQGDADACTLQERIKTARRAR